MSCYRWHRRTGPGSLVLGAGLSLLILTCRTLDAQQPAENSAVSRSRQAALEIKAEILVDAIIDDLRDHLVEQDRLVERIIEAPGEHRVAAASRKLLLTWAQEELDGQYEQRLREIHERINQEQPEREITLDWLRGRAEVLRPGALPAAKSTALQRFPDVFKVARKEAVQRQWIDLQPRVTRYLPEAGDIERIETRGGRDWSFVRQRLEVQLVSEEGMPWRNNERQLVLFEENTEQIDYSLQVYWFSGNVTRWVVE